MIISGERTIGYDEIHTRIARAATGFRALGLSGGAPVAMMLRNDFAFFEVSGGAAALGSPVVPINWHLKAEEVGYFLADSGADILVCHADLLPQISRGLPGEGQHQDLVGGESATLHPVDHRFDERGRLARARTRQHEQRSAGVVDDRLLGPIQRRRDKPVRRGAIQCVHASLCRSVRSSVI